MANILILNGSPRLRGNTYSLIESFKRGAEKGNNKIFQFNLAFMNIHDSIGNGDQLIDDDMKEIFAKLDECEYVIFASPLYFSSFSGYLKNAIDRLHSYEKEGKKLLVFISMASSEKSSLNPLLEQSKLISKYLKWSFEELVYLPSCLGKNDHNEHLAELEKPFQIGLSIK